MAKHGDITYSIQKSPSSRPVVVHVDHLKLFNFEKVPEEWSSFGAPVTSGVDQTIQGVGRDGEDLSDMSRDDIDSVQDEGGADFHLLDCRNEVDAPRYPRRSVRKRCLPSLLNDFEMM